MALLQVLAARLAGLDCLRFYVFDDRGHATFRAGMTDLERVIATAASGPAGSAGEPLERVIERITDLGYEWGISDGN
jgi:hypothetical protein